MDTDNFQQLERRIADAIQMITGLREERDQISRRRDELEASFNELEGKHRQLTEELDSVRESTVPREEFDSRKAQIERRVQTLLERFEELDAAEEQSG